MWKRTALGLLATAAVSFGAAAEDLDVKFTLDWKFQGPTSPFILAKERGYYADEGINVTIDQGQGSAGAVNRVASGTYDMGFADINALIEYNANNPDLAIKSVMMMYDAPPFSLFSLKSTGIAGPDDLAGRVLGAPVFDASYKLFPAFAAATGVDENAVEKQNMDPALREAMLVRGDVDFISGHYFSSFLDLKAKGVNPDDMVIMLYADFGLDFYGNSVIASPAMVAEHPDKVAGFVRATYKGLRDVLEDPAAGVAAVKKIDPLIDDELELERLQLAIDTNIITDYTKENGVGDVDMARLSRSIDQVAASYGLDSKPPAEGLFTSEFLPPKEERMVGDAMMK